MIKLPTSTKSLCDTCHSVESFKAHAWNAVHDDFGDSARSRFFGSCVCSRTSIPQAYREGQAIRLHAHATLEHLKRHSSHSQRKPSGPPGVNVQQHVNQDTSNCTVWTQNLNLCGSQCRPAL